MSEGPNQGRMVRYVLASGRSAGQARPAMVVRDWSEKGNGCVNLQVFLDGSNDSGAEGTPEVFPAPASVVCFDVPATCATSSAMRLYGAGEVPQSFSKYTPLTVWVTSANYSEEKTPGTWHWPTIVR